MVLESDSLLLGTLQVALCRQADGACEVVTEKQDC